MQVMSEKNKKFESWCKGKTGFPIVDAGMRQVKETGCIQNHLRIIVINFLSLLGIDWRKGEEYFSKKLVDYNSSNNRNLDKIYNPFTQAKEIDPKCEYIKEWVDELKLVDNYDILRWDKVYKEYKGVYRFPIVDIRCVIKETKKRYKRHKR